MTFVTAILKLLFGCIILAASLFAVVVWSMSNVEAANGECEMRIIENKITPILQQTEYRRACMASKGYRMDPSCYVNNYTSAPCFVPRWMVWRNAI